MRIVLDAMGSDIAPVPDVDGAVQAARLSGDTIILVGDQVAIERELARYNTTGLKLEVVPASQFIDMHDKPSQVIHLKPDSSMMVGMRLVKEGNAEAFVTAGNTGAALAIATLGALRRIRGVKRPTLTALVPLKGRLFILTDLGANADAKPDWLVQFGLMGSLYAERVVGVKNPRVAMLTNGEEEGKGNQLVKEASLLFAESGLNYIGNLEPKEMLSGGADVVVADGFVGNITLKSMEALADMLFSMVRDELTATLITKLGAAIVRPALRRVFKQLDPFEVGGAPLLGVDGVVMIGHGRTNAKGIKNAIFEAHKAVEGRIVEAIRDGVAKYADQDADE